MMMYKKNVKQGCLIGYRSDILFTTFVSAPNSTFGYGYGYYRV